MSLGTRLRCSQDTPGSEASCNIDNSLSSLSLSEAVCTPFASSIISDYFTEVNKHTNKNNNNDYLEIEIESWVIDQLSKICY